MKAKRFVVACAHGLHIRVAGQVAKLVSSHDSTVRITGDEGQEANAASVLEILLLGAGQGSHVEVRAEGPDETVVMEELGEVFERGAGI